MIVAGLSKSKARSWLESNLKGQPPSEPFSELGCLPRGNAEERIARARTGLVALCSHLDGESETTRAALFDAQASALLHSALEDLPVGLSSDPDFWRYLSCGPLFSVVQWRHPLPHGFDVNSQDGWLRNVGLSGRWYALPERLWYRAHLSLGPSDVAGDRYALSRRGTVDFWASGPTRHEFGASRSLTRALVRYQYPEEGVFDARGSYKPSTLGPNALRELYKHLRHFNRTTELAWLSEEDAFALVTELGDLVRSLEPDHQTSVAP